jgi:hypothetical protein
MTLEKGLRSVRVSEPTPAPNSHVRLKLTENGSRLRFLSPGSYVVASAAAADHPVTFQAWTDVADPAAVITISGNARLMRYASEVVGRVKLRPHCL